MFDHTKIDFEVEKFSLIQSYEDYEGFSTQDKVPSDIGVGLRRKDTKQVLGIVSDNYSITQYDEIVNGVEEALALAQVDTTDAEFTTEVHDGGAKLELRAKFPAHAMSMVGIPRTSMSLPLPLRYRRLVSLSLVLDWSVCVTGMILPSPVMKRSTCSPRHWLYVPTTCHVRRNTIR